MKLKPFWVLLVILLLATTLRFYRAAELTVFLADQGYMAQQVLNMLRGNFTLIGPISSVGGFYNGPAVYYLMLPFFWLFKGDPFAGTVFQSLLSIATIPLIYLLGRKLKNETVGLIASFLFAISPLMIDYSRAIFNTHPAVFFSTGIVYWFTILNKKRLNLKLLVLGFLLGINFQLHYLTTSLLLLTFAYPCFFQKNLLTKRYYVLVGLGFLLTLSPLILFELRHQFFNTTLLFRYLLADNETVRSHKYIFLAWPEITGKLFFGNNRWLGLLGVLGIIWTLVRVRPKLYLWLLGLVFFTGALYGGYLQSHYIVAIHTPLILLLSLTIYYLTKKNNFLILLACGSLLFINAGEWNLAKPKHPLQDGLNIDDFKKTAKIIIADKNKKVYNVAMHAQGDNRAVPLRYVLSWYGSEPNSYEEYFATNTLYFLLKKSEAIKQQTMWEFTSFASDKIAQRWTINQDYYLYKLVK